jgi:hypothetical protein
MPEITVTVSDEVAAQLAVLTDPSMLTSTATVADAARDAVAVLIDHAQQGIYRPGSWERPWLQQVFGDDFERRLVPDTRPEMLSGDGRVIFDRPREGGTDG